MKILEIIEKKGIVWSTLGGNTISMVDRMEIIESLASTTNSLLETNSTDKRQRFEKLWTMSDSPITGTEYIVIPLCLLNNKIMVLEQPITMKFVNRNHQEMIFDDNGQTKKYPCEVIRDTALYNTFIFLDESGYDRFQGTIWFEFGYLLPNIN